MCTSRLARLKAARVRCLWRREGSAPRRSSELHPERELWPTLGFWAKAGCVWPGWVRVFLVRARLGWDLEQISWSMALYGRPSAGPSASALDGSAREFVMDVEWREEKWDRGIAAVRARGARPAGIVAQSMVGC